MAEYIQGINPTIVKWARERSGYTLQELAKYAGTRRWVSAVNNWGRLGKWDSHVCKDPQQLRHELAFLARNRDS